MFGVKDFLKGKDIPDELSVKEAIDITNGAYGSDEFKRFLK